jgi:uncharacterized protein
MLVASVLAVAILLGHLGLWLTLYNRLNATSWPRPLIKSLERGIILVCLLLPLVVGWFDGARVPAGEWLEAPVEQLLAARAPWFSAWAIASLLALILLGPGWLESRGWLWPPRNLRQHAQQRYRVAEHVPQDLTPHWLSRLCDRMPLNEMTHLSVTDKTLELEASRPRTWQSLTIGHLSDLHFTGLIAPEYYEFAMTRLMEKSPDVVVLTGDIIDKDACVDWLESILGPVRAPLGRYFVIGNHERRLKRLDRAIERLRAAGWFDLGLDDACIEPMQPRQPRIRLLGNERPWFVRDTGSRWQLPAASEPGAEEELWVGVAHTPDQYPWARRLGLDLLLAGHTHGGQVRIPGIGPLVSPSWHGSRFASGVFRLPPTVMHVSRGLSGCHPLRWRCPPEVTLLRIEPPRATGPA